MFSKIRSAKNYVQTHKKHCAITAAAVTVAVLQHKGIKDLNEFIDSKNLLDEYYTVED